MQGGSCLSMSGMVHRQSLSELGRPPWQPDQSQNSQQSSREGDLKSFHDALRTHKQEQRELIDGLMARFDQRLTNIEGRVRSTAEATTQNAVILKELSDSFFEIKEILQTTCASSRVQSGDQFDASSLLQLFQQTQQDVARLADDLQVERKERHKTFETLMGLQDDVQSRRSASPPRRTFTWTSETQAPHVEAPRNMQEVLLGCYR